MRPWLPVPFVLLLALGARQDESHFAYDEADVVVEATMLGSPEAYDGDVAWVGDDLWLAFLEYVPGKGDRLWVGRGGEEPEQIEAPSRLKNPKLTLDPDGNLWLSYEGRAEEDEHWSVFARWRPAEPPEEMGFTEEVLVGREGLNDINHDVAAGQFGLWFTWQGELDGQFEIFARRMFPKERPKTSSINLSRSPWGDWHPSVAVDQNGYATFVWDGYDGESFDVYACRHEGDYWTKTGVLAGTPAFEGRAQVASDGRGRTWVLWEEGAENWGAPYRSVKELWNNVTDASGPVHRLRRLRMGVLGLGTPAVAELAEPLPMPSFGPREGLREGVRDLGVFYERGELVVDWEERPWVVYRHYHATQLGRDEPVVHHIEEGWNVYARCLTDEGWSKLHRFDVAQRDGMQRLSVSPYDAGIAAIWDTGRTDRRKDERERGLALATIELSEGEAPSPRFRQAEPITADRGWPRDYTLGRRSKERAVFRPGDPPKLDTGLLVIGPDDSTIVFNPSSRDEDGWLLFFGDLHRHTDLSLCFPFFDGSIDDAYRYAIDMARLDFLGITDHTRDIARGEVQSQLWWRSTKEVERHQLAGGFVPYFAYERSHRDTDHNVISLRDDMLRNFPPPLPEFWGEIDDRDTFTIPHNPFIGKVWENHDDEKRPLIEIYQGFRDEASEEHAHRGLTGGHRFGFIASSDHLSTSASFAGVWARETDRESIFRGLQTRRTYGATDKIILAFFADDHWMGERIVVTDPPAFLVLGQGTAEIAELEVIVDGEVVRRIPVDDLTVHSEFRLDEHLADSSWVYVRVNQEDGNRAWSSPIWIELSR